LRPTLIRPIFICFEHPEISLLFQSLINSMGFVTRCIAHPQHCLPLGRLITEPKFFENLPTQCKANCLVVGDREVVRKLSTLYLDTPLTENKIRKAIQAFLED
jgi:hypothetical protein